MNKTVVFKLLWPDQSATAEIDIPKDIPKNQVFTTAKKLLVQKLTEQGINLPQKYVYVKTYEPEWTPFTRGYLPALSEEEIQKRAREMSDKLNRPFEECYRTFQEIQKDEVWINNKYQVNIDRNPEFGQGWPEMIHLSIKRRDKQPIHDWRDIQRIKNELFGPENEGVELYPAESRLCDTANQFHAWILKEPGRIFPFGFFGGRLVTSESIGGEVQRSREDTDEG